MKKYPMMLVLIIGAIVTHAQVYTDAEEAFKISDQTKRPVFLIFSGSDWCAPCVEFDKKIMQNESFKQFADESLVVLKADFPQREKLPVALQEQNEKLAAIFNPRGQFPLLLVIRSDRSLLANLPFVHQSVNDFIAQIKKILPPAP